MYVRNYGSSARRSFSGERREDTESAEHRSVDRETDNAERELQAAGMQESYNGTVTLREPKDESQDESPEKLPASPEASDSVAEEGNPSEFASEPRFGERGIPRQPLRRRKLPSRIPTEEVPSSIGMSEEKNGADEEMTAEDIFAEAFAENSVSRGNSREFDEKPPDSSEKDSAIAHRRKGGELPFSGEELLLGGLLILLLNDHANDDIIFLLGFLLFMGGG